MPSIIELSAAKPRSDWADFSIAIVVGLGLTLAAVFLGSMPLAGHMAASRDFVCYWATGQRLVHHANPYDRAAVSRLEHAAGLSIPGVLIMRNPPWALPLAYPLGFLGLRVAALFWSLLLLACLAVSVQLVRRMHGSPPNYIHWLGLGFTPALICVTMGQTSLFALLGLALFLRYHQDRPFCAGLALWLCSLKPHLFLPFGVALAAWMVLTRAWKLLAGAAVALAATTALAFAIDPSAWPNYMAMLRSKLVESEFVPCLGDALRHWLWPQHPWTRYLLAMAACAWALVYFWRRRKTWDWKRNGGILMLVSLAAAPYCFVYDQGLAIPALMEAGYATRKRYLLIVLCVAILGLDFQLSGAQIVSPRYLWTAPAWLAWYLLAGRGNRPSGAPAGLSVEPPQPAA